MICGEHAAGTVWCAGGESALHKHAPLVKMRLGEAGQCYAVTEGMEVMAVSFAALVKPSVAWYPCEGGLRSTARAM